MDRYRLFDNKRFIKIILVCIPGIIINLLGYVIVQFFHLPIFLDSIGTMFIGVLSGYLPAIIVGITTNIIMSFTSSSYIYYAIINILIAVVVSYCSRKGVLKHFYGGIIVFVILAISSLLLSNTLDYFLNGMYGTDESFMAMFMDKLPVEVIDKALSVFITFLAIYVFPKSITNMFEITGWQQTPLTKEEVKAVRKSKNRRVSLRTKILLLLVVACVSIGAVAMIISMILYRNYSIDDYYRTAESTVNLEIGVIDPEKIDEYIEKGDSSQEYREVERRLYSIKESSKDINYIYVYKILEDGCHVVFDLDTEDVEGEEPGAVVEFDKSFEKKIDALLAGKEIDPIITDDTYGWLVTVYKPIYNKAGECVCYAAADISMDVVKSNEYSFLAKLLSLFLGFFSLILAVGLWISEYNIVFPVNTMALSASAFAYDNEESLEENVSRIEKLKIMTGDEIENLYNAFTKTTENNVRYVNVLNEKTETIAQMQDALIIVLADMVENRDEETGDHIRKTAAYTRIIMESLMELGYYTDQLTEKFMYDVEHSAPLHDIGKIAVSDVILNKPGKLTDEEFEIMKTHTTAGAQILSQVIEKVPDSGYLLEAKNLAEYHHEKWNGNGYPKGLSGEDIPLSARIMAVADVFDALVSERCYKKAFPFEKAMGIIQEDAGTHFDPKISEAFKHAEDKVREVAEHFSEVSNSKYL